MFQNWQTFQISSSTACRLGESVVLRTTKCLTSTVKFDIYNYLTSVQLLTHLGVHNFRATGVLNNANALSLGTNSCKKVEHGNFEQGPSSKETV